MFRGLSKKRGIFMLFFNSKIAKKKIEYAINNNIQLSLDDCYNNPSLEKRKIYNKWFKYFYTKYFNIVKFSVLSYSKQYFTIVVKIEQNDSIDYYYITPTKNYFYSEAYR